MKKIHTPGPWTYVASTERHGAYVDGGPLGDTVCDCYTLSVRNDGTSKLIPFLNSDANARLIAAAPELLEALKAMMDMHSPRGGNIVYDGPYDLASAAIANAEGK